MLQIVMLQFNSLANAPRADIRRVEYATLDIPLYVALQVPTRTQANIGTSAGVACLTIINDLMKNHGITRIITADDGFDVVDWVRGLDLPAEAE